MLAPFLCQLFNWSLQHGCVPSSFKASYITPLLKKAGLDPADVRFYRPTSNLAVISKLLEQIVSSQLVKYLKDKGLLPDLQSAYRAMHSTETSVLKVFSDILLALDSGNLPVLTMLDLSAAFDSVDHDTLLQRLYVSPMVCRDVYSIGSPHIVVDEFNTSACLQPVQHHPKSFSVFHRVQFWDRSCSFFTRSIYSSW